MYAFCAVVDDDGEMSVAVDGSAHGSCEIYADNGEPVKHWYAPQMYWPEVTLGA